MRGSKGHQTHGRFVLRTSVAAVVMALGGTNAALGFEIDSGKS
jgi:hypothetical protein